MGDGHASVPFVDRTHGDYNEADDDQGDDRDDLTKGEPEFGLAESLTVIALRAKAAGRGAVMGIHGDRFGHQSACGDDVSDHEMATPVTTQHARQCPSRNTKPGPRADQVARDVREGRVLAIRQVSKLAERGA